MKKIVSGLIAAFFFIIAYFYLSSQKISPLEKEKGNTYFLPPIWKREYRSTFLRSKKEKKQANISMKWRD